MTDTLLADSTWSDAGGPTVRTYYTFPLAAGFDHLYAVIHIYGASWSTDGAMIDEVPSWWWSQVILVGGPWTFSDPNPAYVTDGSKRLQVSTNNIGGIQTMRVQVYGTPVEGSGGSGSGSSDPAGDWLRLVHHG